MRISRAREMLGDGVAVRTSALADPSAAHGLHALAEEEAAALVVVGSAHAGHVGRVFPGTVGERLLHGSPCPVAVVPRGYRDRSGGLAAIGCAYDGSDEAKTALRAATEVARAVGGTLRIVMAVQPPAMVHTGAPGPAYVELLEDIRAAARAELDNAIRELPADVQPEPVLAEDVDVVGRLARESEALDLLVVGSRGYGPLRAVLLGGVTGPLMREAACPIVAIPRGATAALGSLFRAAAAPSEA